MRSLPLHFNPNSDLLLSLQDIANEQYLNGFILGAVGNLSKVRFKCPSPQSPKLIEGNLELITLSGTISPTNLHIHISIADSSCNVSGGHLEEGTIVLKGIDLLVGLLEIDDNKLELEAGNQNNKIVKPRISIYVLKGCPWSKRAIRLLNSYNLNYSKHQITSDDEYNKIFQLSNSSSFPQIFINDNFIGGYDALADLHKKGNLSKLL
tara:strand:+ start:312 stop:935 length:624 start_codon:yes stop_codon:yes gene_type:complete